MKNNNTDYLYNLLSSGSSSEDLVAQFTNALNAAQKRVTEEQEAKRKAEEEAKAAVAAKEVEDAEKRAMMSTIIDTFMNYVTHFYPTLGANDSKEYRDTMVDSMIEIVDKCSTLGDLMQNIELSATNDGNKVSIKFQFDEPTEAVKKEDEGKYFYNPFFHWFF